MKCMRQYADFNGRARRSEYWYFVLFSNLIMLIPMVIFVIIFALAGAGMASNPDSEAAATGLGVFVVIGQLVLGAVSLVFVIPSLAVSVRRLHDMDREAIYLLLAFVPFGSFILLYFYIQDGTPGPNRFGPDPKGRMVAYNPGYPGQSGPGPYPGQPGPDQYGRSY